MISELSIGFQWLSILSLFGRNQNFFAILFLKKDTYIIVKAND